MIRLIKPILLFTIAISALSCSSYKQNIMFRTPEGFQPSQIDAEANKTISDYRIQKNDYLNIDIYSNKGERLIDPNPQLTDNTAVQNGQVQKINYLVNTEGKVKLPMVGELDFENLTIREAELATQDAYSHFFKEPYVVINFVNKRAILLGASGGQVIPLANPNMHLTEVLALGKGIDNNGIANNIRVLRNDEVFVVDLSTIEGYRTGDMLIQPGDIIYIEPIRRPATEALNDNSRVFSLIISLASILVVIISLKP